MYFIALLFLLVVGLLIWQFGRRFLLLAANVAAQKAGVQVIKCNLKGLGVHGMVIECAKGPVARLEVQTAQLHGVLALATSILSGNQRRQLALQATGLCVQLAQRHSSARSKLAQSSTAVWKPPSLLPHALLKLLPDITAQVSDVQVVLGAAGPVARIESLTLGSTSRHGILTASLELGALSVCASVDSQPDMSLLASSGLTVTAALSSSRFKRAVWLDDLSIDVRPITLSADAQQLTQLLQQMASSRGISRKPPAPSASHSDGFAAARIRGLLSLVPAKVCIFLYGVQGTVQLSSPDSAILSMSVSLDPSLLSMTCKHAPESGMSSGAGSDGVQPPVHVSVQLNGLRADAQVASGSDVAASQQAVSVSLKHNSLDMHLTAPVGGVDVGPAVHCSGQLNIKGCAAVINQEQLHQLLVTMQVLKSQFKLLPCAAPAAANGGLTVPIPVSEPAGHAGGTHGQQSSKSAPVVHVQLAAKTLEQIVVKLRGPQSGHALVVGEITAALEAGAVPVASSKAPIVQTSTLNLIGIKLLDSASTDLTKSTNIVSVKSTTLTLNACQLHELGAGAAAGGSMTRALQLAAVIKAPAITLSPEIISHITPVATELIATIAAAHAASKATAAAASAQSSHAPVKKSKGKAVLQQWSVSLQDLSLSISHPTQCHAEYTFVAHGEPAHSSHAAQELPSVHTVRISTVSAFGVPQDARWVARLADLSLQQYAPSVPSRQAGGGKDGSTIPALNVMPVLVERLELRGRTASEFQLVKASTERVKLWVDFDTVLLGLSLARLAAQSAVPILTAAAHAKAARMAAGASQSGVYNNQAIESSVQTGMKARKAAAVFELRAQDIEVEAHVGKTDDVSVSVGLIRGSSKLKEVVADEVLLTINGRQVLASNYVSAAVPVPLNPSGNCAAVDPLATTDTPGSPSGPSASGGVQIRPGAGHTAGHTAPDDSVDLSDDATSGTADEGTDAHLLLGSPKLDEPATSLGNRRAQMISASGTTAARAREVRRQAARDRCGVRPTSATDPPAAPAVQAAAHAPPTELSIKGIDLVLEGAVLSIPHDEAPMRVYVLCEVLAKAVQQVIGPSLSDIKQAASTRKKPAISAKHRADELAAPGKYIEVVLECRKLGLVLDNHPMEAWMALHTSALRQTAAQRQLWERLVASMPTVRSASVQEAAAPGPTFDKLVGPLTASMRRRQALLGSVSVQEEGEGSGVDSSSSSGEEDSVTGGASGMMPAPSGAAEPTAADGPNPWAAAMKIVVDSYVEACKGVASAASNAGAAAGALLSLQAARGSGVLMVIKPGTWGRQDAVKHIRRMDPPSQGIEFERIVPLSLDATLGGVTVHMTGASQPLLTAASLGASGWIIRARQLASVPTMRTQLFPLGRYHAAPVAMTVKGSRPPMKAYTDLKVEVEELGVAGGIGLIPAFGQLAKAIKRVIPPDALNPDGSEARPPPACSPTLQPWDKARYMWRGSIRLAVRQLSATLAADLCASPSPQEPCAQVTASTLAVTVTTGRCDVTATGLSALAHARSPDSGPCDPLLVLPLLHVPLLSAAVHGTWRLESGRDALEHHIFPPWEEGAVQTPLDIASLVRAEGLSLGLEINLASDYTMLGSRQAATARSAGSSGVMGAHFAAGHKSLQPSPMPRAYLGELQVAFIRELVELMAGPPLHLKSAPKRRCFYDPVRPPDGAEGVKGPVLGLVLSKLDLNVGADVLEVHHDAQDPEDISDFVFLRASSVHYASTFAFSRTSRKVLRRGQVVSIPAAAKQMTSLLVEAQELQLARPLEEAVDVQGGRTGAGRQSAQMAQGKGSGGGGAARSGPSSGKGTSRSLEGMMDGASQGPSPGFGTGLVLCASRLMLRQMPAASKQVGEQPRPIRMVVQDVCILGSAELRDACIATVMHLIAAFSYKPRAFLARARAASRLSATIAPDAEDHAAHAVPGTASTHADVLQPVAHTAYGLSAAGLRRAMAAAVQPPSEAVLREEDALLSQLLDARARRLAAAAALDDEEQEQQEDDDAEASTHSGPAGVEGSSHSNVATASRTVSASGVAKQQSSSTPTSQLLFEMEFVRVQICLLPDNCPGCSLLLATDSALLTITRAGSTGGAAARSERTLCVSMDAMQAYAYAGAASRLPGSAANSLGGAPAAAGPAAGPAALTGPQHTAPVSWLLASEGRLAPPSDPFVHTVMTPFSCRIKHASVKDVPGAAAGFRPGSEVVVQVPSVEGQLDSWQFDVLADVIQNVLMVPLPHVPLLLTGGSSSTARRGGAAGAEEDPAAQSSEVAAASAVQCDLRMNCAALQQELTQVVPGAVTALWAASASDWGAGPVTSSPAPQQLLAVLFGARPERGSAAAVALGKARDVLVAWCMDQVVGAADSVDAAGRVLARVRAEVELLARTTAAAAGAPSRNAAPLSATVSLGHFEWALSRGGAVFVVAQLDGLQYTSGVDSEYMGSTRLQLRSVSMRDTRGLVGPTPGTVAGTILTLWNPGQTTGGSSNMALSSTAASASSLVPGTQLDGNSRHGGAAGGAAPGAGGADAAADVGGSWEHEAALSVYMIHGGLEGRYLVYDHIEVVLHPLLLHLTSGLAAALQDYFSLREGEGGDGAASGGGAALGAPGGASSGGEAGTHSLARGSPAKAAAAPRAAGGKGGWLHRRGTSAELLGGENSVGPLEAALGPLQQSRVAGTGSASNVPPLPAVRPPLSPERLLLPPGLAPAVAGAGGAVLHQVPPAGLHAAGPSGVPTAAARARAMTADAIHADVPNRYGPLYRRGRLASRSNSGDGGVLAAHGVVPVASGFRSHKRASSGGVPRGRDSTAGGASVAVAAHMHHRGAAGARAGPAARAHRLYRFKHVRFNRMHARVTYEGPPLSLTDFRLVLDVSVYHNLEGSWRTILNKYKWDVVRSAIKSAAGWQRGKVQELERGSGMPGAGTGTHGEGEDSASMMGRKGAGGGLRENLKSWFGRGLRGVAGAGPGGEGRSQEEERALAELMATAERARQKAAKLALLLGEVPPLPRKPLARVQR